jgi:nitrate reductase cytochrome c-type subunit
MKKSFERLRSQGNLPSFGQWTKGYGKDAKNVRKMVKKALGKKFKEREERMIQSYLKTPPITPNHMNNQNIRAGRQNNRANLIVKEENSESDQTDVPLDPPSKLSI